MLKKTFSSFNLFFLCVLGVFFSKLFYMYCKKIVPSAIGVTLSSLIIIILVFYSLKRALFANSDLLVMPVCLIIFQKIVCIAPEMGYGKV
jgi:FtsH-binding integral membrane protein